jgi:glyoxylase-like metal-dependent hydrolase (beta-lactamase superfamily II)
MGFEKMNLVKPIVKAFFEKNSCTWSYVVSDAKRFAAIIDSVLDFDVAACATNTKSCEEIIDYVKQEKLQVLYLLDTHSHADHLTGSQYLKSVFPNAKKGISCNVVNTQNYFKKVWDLTFPDDGSQFDLLLHDYDVLPLGDASIKVLHTPGHTIDSCSFVIGDAVFVGDTIFKEDSGTARCDFPNGDAELLYDSIQKILALDPKTRVFLCHDYGAGGSRDYEFASSVEDQLNDNIHVKTGSVKQEFVKARDARDSTLSLPKLIIPSIQFNIQGGMNLEYLKLVFNKADKYSRNYQ